MQNTTLTRLTKEAKGVTVYGNSLRNWIGNLRDIRWPATNLQN